MCYPDTRWVRAMLLLPWSWWPLPLEVRAAEHVPIVDLPELLRTPPRRAEGAEA